MSEPDRPTPTDQGPQWPLPDDPEATRIVQRSSLPASGSSQDARDDASRKGTAEPAPESPTESLAQPLAAPTAEPSAQPPVEPSAALPPEPPAEASTPSVEPARQWADEPAPWAQRRSTGAANEPPAWPGASHGVEADAEPTTALPPRTEPGAVPGGYTGAPTAVYPGPAATPGYPASGGYSYQQGQGYSSPSTGPTSAGPQVIPPPPTANVVLPPVRMPKAESRAALNLLGSVVGLILVAGGLVLALLFQGKMRTLGTANLGSATSGNGTGALAGTLDVLSVVLTIVGVLLVALAALLAAWASWAAILPGLLLAAASVWAMITTGANSGGVLIDRGTSWAFKDGQLAAFCMSGMGLLVGLLLLLAGLAAVFLRAGVRRTIRQQLDSIQA